MEAGKPQSGLFFSLLDTQQTKSHAEKDTHSVGCPCVSCRADRKRLGWRTMAGIPPLSKMEKAFRHGGWLLERARVREALVRAEVSAARLERFDECGSDCVAEYSPSRSKYRLRACYCGDRFCLPCCRARARRVENSLRQMIGNCTPLFITLTLKNSDEPLRKILDHLIRSFAKLRRCQTWSENVKAGAYVIEIKKGLGSRLWHVHLHVLCLGKMPWKTELSDSWRVSSEGSYIVDVQRCFKSEKAIGYVAKYATKGWTAEVTRDRDALLECMCALRGRRLFGTFGAWRSVELDVEDDGPSDWRRVGSLTKILSDHLGGQVYAAGVLRALAIDAERISESMNDPPGVDV